MNDIEVNRLHKLELLDLSLDTRNVHLNIDWFRTICDNSVPNGDWHAHSSLEIHFVTMGTIDFYFADEVIHVTAGQAILIPANYLHRLENSNDQPYFRYILNVSAEPLNEDPEALFLQNALAIVKPVCMPIRSQIASLLESCLNEADERIGGFLTLIQCNIQTILISMARELTHQRKASYCINEKWNYDKQRAQQIIRYIDESLSDGLTVENIAQYMHLSTKQVQRIIQSQFGLTVKQLIMQLRLRKSKALLKDPNLSIGTISSMVCFSNEQNFSRFFRHLEGQAPVEYRNGILPR